MNNTAAKITTLEITRRFPTVLEALAPKLEARQAAISDAWQTFR